MKNKKELILRGPIYKVVLALAVPVMISNLMQTLYNLVDTFWIGKYEMIHGLSGELISSVILIFPAIGIMLALAGGISAACISLISQYIGASNNEQAKKVAGQALTFAFISSLILGIIGAMFAPEIVNLLGGGKAPELVVLNGAKYLKIIFWGLPSVFIFFTYNAIKQAQGDTISPMIFSFLSVVANIILDPILMINLDMGIEGAAFATVLSRSVFILFAVVSLFKESDKHIKLDLIDLKPNKEIMFNLLKIGLPASLSGAMSSFGFAVLNGFVISFGNSTFAAFGLGNRITGLILMPAMGIGNALGAIVGQNLGANNLKRAKQAVKASFLLSSAILIVGGAGIFVYAENIILTFSKDAEIVTQAVYYLRLIIATIPLMAAFSTLNGTFIGSGHTMLSFIISAGRLWCLRIPLIILFKSFTDLGTNSVWYAMIISNFIICIIGYVIYKSGKWETKITKEPKVKVA